MADELTDEQRDLSDAEAEWHVARKELANCYASCEYDRAYFCHSQIETERKAGVEFYRRMDAYIDQRVLAILTGRRGMHGGEE